MRIVNSTATRSSKTDYKPKLIDFEAFLALASGKGTSLFFNCNIGDQRAGINLIRLVEDL
jgi:hypothetical protein